ncbi:hypothetical protein Esti_002640 [Eimeria stiedai]
MKQRTSSIRQQQSSTSGAPPAKAEGAAAAARKQNRRSSDAGAAAAESVAHHHRSSGRSSRLGSALSTAWCTYTSKYPQRIYVLDAFVAWLLLLLLLLLLFVHFSGTSFPKHAAVAAAFSCIGPLLQFFRLTQQQQQQRLLLREALPAAATGLRDSQPLTRPR